MFVIIAQNFALQLVSEGGITRVSTHIGTYFGQNTLEHTKMTKMVCALSFLFLFERHPRGRAVASVRKGTWSCVGPT